MKSVKRALCILMTLVLLVLCGCNEPDNTESQGEDLPPVTEEKELNLQILYCANDTLNPYKTKNKSNAELGRLLYDSLVSLNDDFEVSYVLAESISCEENIYTVKLRNATFSNNTPVTSEDVLSSYALAKESDAFKNLFYNVKSVSAPDSSTVLFELSKHDPYFASILTFPIIKKGSDELKNEDNVEIEPIGSGRYIFSHKDDCLIKNPYHFGEVITDKISLVNAPDSESVEHYVEIGATDFYYTDPANNNIVRMSGKKTALNMNNLVYLGINHSYGALSSPQLRHAISSALDRDTISKSAFYGYAKSATGFFHPDWSETSGYQTVQTTADPKISIENLEKIGYNSLDTDGYRINSNNISLSFSLLVNDSNPSRLAAAELIREQLKTIGIKITVTAVSDSQYFEALSSGHFQLYLGEVRLTANMDIGNLVLEGKSAAYGIKNSDSASEESAADYSAVIRSYYSGESSVTEVATSLINYMPVIPLLYRNSLLFYSENLDSVDGASAYDIFLSLNN